MKKVLLVAESFLTPWILVTLGLFSKKLKGTVLERLALRRWPDIVSAPAKVWIHAASVGELVGVYPIINEFVNNYSSSQIVVTSQSPNGLDALQQRYPRIRTALMPVDSVGLFKRLMKRLSLERLVIAESEVWPGMISAAKEVGAEVELVNAKISDYSWKRLKKLKTISRPFYSSIDLVLCQSKVDFDRYLSLGVDESRLKIVGNTKYDFSAATGIAVNKPSRPYFVAGSVRAGEEQAVIGAFIAASAKLPELSMVFAPRQVERFGYMYDKLQRAGFNVSRRSRSERPSNVVLVDTLGELSSFYSGASVAFVGGSLIDQGGHNPLEPAAEGVPVVMGPYYSKVASVVKELERVGGLKIVSNSAELSEVILSALDGSWRVSSRELVDVANSFHGATHRTLRELGLSTAA